MENIKKFQVMFEGGESINSTRKNHGVDYMLVKGELNGVAFELYAEIEIDSCPNFEKILEEIEENNDITEFMNGVFDLWAYEILKEEILKQAKEKNIPAELLEF